MAKEGSKEDEYLTNVGNADWCDYVDREEKVIGVYSDPDDAYAAEKSFALKQLRGRFHYKVQMVIK